MPKRVIVLLALCLVLAAPATAAPAEGQLTWAVPYALTPAALDPADASGVQGPFIAYYAIHDALAKPMPGRAVAPSLAESWSGSAGGLTYDFVLRPGVRFHNGDPVTADDVKFSFERYRGVSAKALKDRVRHVEVVDARRVRFHLREPWLDFLTFYTTPATGASWVVPRKYVERVGEDGFRKAPVGAGPYRFVSLTPGIQLVVEANEGYWRKAPSVRRLVLKTVPDETTRLAMLKTGETDVAYVFRQLSALDIRRTPGLALKAVSAHGNQWVLFTEQWNPKSPWADRRVRLAANLALDRQAMSEAVALGLSRPIASMFPRGFDAAWAAPPYAHDPQRARQLLSEAGYPNGIDAEVWAETALAETSELVANDLTAAGIRTRVRVLERAALYAQHRDKKLGPLVYTVSGAYGNIATRLDTYVAAGGIYTHGTYPDIEDLIRQQAVERDRKRRDTLLRRIQELVHDRAMVLPTIDGVLLHAHGPRVAESALGLVDHYLFSAPYEDTKLKGP